MFLSLKSLKKITTASFFSPIKNKQTTPHTRSFKWKCSTGCHSNPVRRENQRGAFSCKRFYSKLLLYLTVALKEQRLISCSGARGECAHAVPCKGSVIKILKPISQKEEKRKQNSQEEKYGSGIFLPFSVTAASQDINPCEPAHKHTNFINKDQRFQNVTGETHKRETSELPGEDPDWWS